MEKPGWTVCKYFPEGCYGTHIAKIFRHGPKQAFHITKALYEKAEKRNLDLTDDERAVLLSRGDTVGKALAQPQSLTLAERYEVLGWGPPEELYASIRRASGGSISRPRELFDKARASAPSYESLTLDELELLILGFQTLEVYKEKRFWHMFPGNEEARNLVWAQQEGVDVAAAACKDLLRDVLNDCWRDPRIRWERYARFDAAERNGETGLLVQEFPPLGCRPTPCGPFIPLPPQPPPSRAEASSSSLPTGTSPPVQPTTTAADAPGVSPMDWMLRTHGIAYPPPPLSVQNQEDLMKWLGALREVMDKAAYDRMTDEEIAGLEAHPERLSQEARDQVARTKEERRQDPDYKTNMFEKYMADSVPAQAHPRRESVFRR
ncbi:hypothetical protein PG993_012644 [Apiospora rasikravindrae]|uniref:Uncharacterized protein n=1 Tax=Apiospora rasikravindrae TaxID=990691 RepID=A0ABR1S3F5_9PEZI